MSSLLKTKDIDSLLAEAQDEGSRLKRTLGPWSLIAFGIGAVIGAGIFTVTGTAAAGQHSEFHSVLNAPVLDLILHGTAATSLTGRPGAGPGLALSFVLVAITCGFAALCYAELASMIPIAGSAYTYAYAALGEIFAWIIGWDLILEYAVSNMTVAVGFSAYIDDFRHTVENVIQYGVSHGWLPSAFANLILSAIHYLFHPNLNQPIIKDMHWTGAFFNLPAFLVVMVLSWILVRGVKESAGANNTMVAIKLVAVLLFVFGAAHAVQSSNFHPFFPNGGAGVLSGAAIVFFTFIGFDSVSTAAEECRDPQRNMPIGIIGTLIACTILYTSVSLVLTGIVNWQKIDHDAPVANALAVIGMDRLKFIVTVGALLGMLSSILVYQYGQARIWFAMSRDKLLPGLFSKVHKRYQTPHVSTWLAGLAVGIPAGIMDIDFFADLANIGTLFAFVFVSLAVIILRRTQPNRARTFRVPFSPVTPIVSVICCLALMLGLPLMAWMGFVIWLIVGLCIYGLYSSKRSLLSNPT